MYLNSQAMFPVEFNTFCDVNKIDIAIYGKKVPRYIRVVKPMLPANWDSTLPMEYNLSCNLKTKVLPTMYSKDVFEIPVDLKLANNHLYKLGGIAGIDIGSCFAVDCLDIQDSDHVLDLCCAPGPKMVYAGEKIGVRGTITGVDISPHRIHTCKQLLRKYGTKNYRLILGDATVFNVSSSSERDYKSIESAKKLLIDLKKARSKNNLGRLTLEKLTWLTEEQLFIDPQNRSYKLIAESEYHPYPVYHRTLSPSIEEEDTQFKFRLYDKVIVDAECSTDGSIKHVLKQFSQNDTNVQSNMNKLLANLQNQNQLFNLQFRLISNGLAMCQRKGAGKLVYATCSMLPSQNELIVYYFLLAHKESVELIDISPHYTKFNYNAAYHAAKKIEIIDILIGQINNSDFKLNDEDQNMLRNKRSKLSPDMTIINDIIMKTVRMDPNITSSSGLFVAAFKTK